MDTGGIPYRIALVENSLVAALPPGVAEVAIKTLDWPYATERKQFPRFSVDRFFVAIRDGKTRYSISGVLEWGVFWYRLDEGLPKAPETEALFWGTIDRLESLIAHLADRLALQRKTVGI